MSLSIQPEEQRSVTVRAPAKINLHLGVGRPRDDGFHPLDTVFQAVGLYDDVRATDGDGTVTVEPAAYLPRDVLADLADQGDNIVVQAARAARRDRRGRLRGSRLVDLRIEKRIPVAGGMAGGSADAAAALVALDRIWGLDTEDDALLDLAARLGSDVPFSLLGGTAHGTGRGERLHAAPRHAPRGGGSSSRPARGCRLRRSTAGSTRCSPTRRPLPRARPPSSQRCRPELPNTSPPRCTTTSRPPRSTCDPSSAS